MENLYGKMVRRNARYSVWLLVKIVSRLNLTWVMCAGIVDTSRGPRQAAAAALPAFSSAADLPSLSPRPFAAFVALFDASFFCNSSCSLPTVTVSTLTVALGISIHLSHFVTALRGKVAENKHFLTSPAEQDLSLKKSTMRSTCSFISDLIAIVSASSITKYFVVSNKACTLSSGTISSPIPRRSINRNGVAASMNSFFWLSESICSSRSTPP
mmetsp:Transcript_25588/g.61530  ORF Transcript_25588/g.61530 Transcript_25588/m.61530 type:complete len:213 (-) Transcript_25588:613-1251(-)